MKNILLAVLLPTLLLTGCSNRIADFTVTSTKNVNLNSTGLVIGDRTTGEDGAAIILIVPTGIPNMKEAVDNAIETDRCSVGLSNVVISKFDAWFVLGGYTAYQVEGNHIIDTKLTGCSPKNSAGK